MVSWSAAVGPCNCLLHILGRSQLEAGCPLRLSVVRLHHPARPHVPKDPWLPPQSTTISDQVFNCMELWEDSSHSSHSKCPLDMATAFLQSEWSPKKMLWWFVLPSSVGSFTLPISSFYLLESRHWVLLISKRKKINSGFLSSYIPCCLSHCYY